MLDNNKNQFETSQKEDCSEKISKPEIVLALDLSDNHFKATSKRMLEYMRSVEGDDKKLGQAREKLAEILYKKPSQEVKAMLSNKSFLIEYSYLEKKYISDDVSWEEKEGNKVIEAKTKTLAITILNSNFISNENKALISVNSIKTINSQETGQEDEYPAIIRDVRDAKNTKGKEVAYNDSFTMVGERAWISIGNKSMVIVNDNEGVTVELYEMGFEDRDPVYSFFYNL